MTKYRVFIAILAIFVYLALPLYEKLVDLYLNSSLKESLTIYAIVRMFNSIISILQDSSISIGIGVEANIALGEALDPLNDLIERFSEIITASLWILGLEKVIFEISKLDFSYIAVVIVSFLFIFFKNKLIEKLFILLILIRIFIPFSAISSYYLNTYFFTPQIEKYKKILKNTQLNKTLNTPNSLKSQINYYIKNKSKILDAFLNLSMIYFAKMIFETILLPLILIWILRKEKL